MSPQRCDHRNRLRTILLTVVLTAFSSDVYGWSVSGTVKNGSGSTLPGVKVTVKDSSKYSAITDDNGTFRLESVVATAPDFKKDGWSAMYFIQITGKEIRVKTPESVSLNLSLVNLSGKILWKDQIVSTNAPLTLTLPSVFRRSGISFLRIRFNDREECLSLLSAADGIHPLSHSSISRDERAITGAAAATYPTLIFKKTDYRDTSITMTSANMSNISVVMNSTAQVCALPTGTLKWQSSGILVNIKPDGSHKIVSVKDPTIQKYNDKYLIYCTVYNTSNSTWSMQFIQFDDFSKASEQTPFFMDQVPGFTGYKCAPELFYFEPTKLWYLIWQQQDPAYSTTTTPDNPSSWSKPKPFFQGGMPNKPSLPIDYWPVADDKNFYIFFTGDDGKVYRIKTTLDKFPGGFSSPVVVKSLEKSIIFEGSSHYKVKGTTNTYLHLVEGMGSTGRYFSAWTSEGIEGDWKDYKVGQTNPFARSNNVTFAQGVTDWSDDVSHGELLRSNPNQTQEIDPCNLQLLYQGMAPGSGGAYERLPYRLGLLTLK
ncbi:MAG: hypothetical protein JW915_02670 [Chitinispirillaceae bacterium]|nr:hypothetical protein [Chitinispirillaceae bacterium]